jgi:hypothetical protein
MDTHSKIQQKNLYDILHIYDDQGTRQKSVIEDIEASRKKTHFLSLYPKIFDYSLGGYYHREHWARTRRYYQISYYLMIKEGTIYLSLYSKQVFDYSLGGYSHRQRWPRTR